MEVAVRELKTKLSAYLKRAAAGEMITVTDRGKPVATLGPVPSTVELSDAVAEGWVTPAITLGLPPVKRHRATASVLQTLTDDRTG